MLHWYTSNVNDYKMDLLKYNDKHRIEWMMLLDMLNENH